MATASAHSYSPSRAAFAILIACIALQQPVRGETKKWEFHLPSLFSQSGKADIVRASEWQKQPHGHHHGNHHRRRYVSKEGAITKAASAASAAAAATQARADLIPRGKGGAVDMARVTQNIQAVKDENAILKAKLLQYEQSKQSEDKTSSVEDGSGHPEASLEEAEPEHTNLNAGFHVEPDSPEWAELGEGDNKLDAAVAGIKPGSTIMVTFADEGMLDFMKNWVLHARKAGISPILVGAMDQVVLREARAFGVRTFSMEHSI
eukprot:8273815-Pyramimonas_sp.AAC.1